MRVRRVWPDCSLAGPSDRRVSPIDAFWVECTPAESAGLVEPRMGKEDHASIVRTRRGYGWPHVFDGQDRCCFLVARDLRFIHAFHAHYPFHQLWNGYSPFRDIDEVRIGHLDELASLRRPLRRPGAETRPG